MTPDQKLSYYEEDDLLFERKAKADTIDAISVIVHNGRLKNGESTTLTFQIDEDSTNTITIIGTASICYFFNNRLTALVTSDDTGVDYAISAKKVINPGEEAEIKRGRFF